MRRLPLFLFCMICGASAARGQGQFQQTQEQGGGDGSDFTQVYPSQNPTSSGGGSDFAQSESRSQASPGMGGGQNGGGMPNGGMPNGGMQNGDGRSDGSSNGQSDGSSEMDLDDARMNFATVVEAYVSKKSSKGYWSYAEKTGGKRTKTWRLKDPSVAEGSVKRRADKRFSGLVKLRDARAGRALTLKFVVDFSGDKWRVISVMPAAPAQ